MKGKKRYTVSLLFNPDGSKVLLQKKDRTIFAGRLNGVGGKVEDEETPADGALREILEETGTKKQHMQKFTWLGTLTLPEPCDTKYPDNYPEIWFFAAIVKETVPKKPETETEEIDWYEIQPDNRPLTDLRTAGDGNLEYFISRAGKTLFESRVTYVQRIS